MLVINSCYYCEWFDKLWPFFIFIANWPCNSSKIIQPITGHLLDQYKRDSTVRIGKWRWPPPKEEVSQDAQGAASAQAAPEGFLEFKMRKRMQEERKRSEEMGDSKSAAQHKKSKHSDPSAEGDANDSFDTSGEIQGKIFR